MSERSTASTVTWALAAAVIAFAVWRLVGSGGASTGSPVEVDRSPGEAARARSSPGADRSSSASGSASSAAGRAGAQGLFVHVAGAVRRPGLVRVAPGSRVAVAVDRAGGATRRADLTGVNLAAQVEDGQQVIVPARGAAGGLGAAASGSASLAPGAPGAPGVPGAPGTPKLVLGSATLEQLDQIDGIGPTLAQHIIDYRTKNGGFGSLEELREVDGIGEKRFETLREALQP